LSLRADQIVPLHTRGKALTTALVEASGRWRGCQSTPVPRSADALVRSSRVSQEASGILLRLGAGGTAAGGDTRAPAARI
jgi:hypothetical protein